MAITFARWLVALRWPLLLLAALAAVTAWLPSQGVKFDRSIENMFADDDPLLPPFHRLKSTFGGDEIVLAVYRDPELLAQDGSGIQRSAQVSKRLRDVDGVSDVLSLAEVDQMLRKLSIGALGGLLGGNSTPPILADGGAGRGFRELFEGYTHDRDGSIAAVACMLMPEADANISRRETIESLRQVMKNLPPGATDGMIAGEPVMVVDGFAYVEDDGSRLGWTSTLLLALTIIVCFRSVRWVLIPVAVVQLTLLLTRAALVMSGLQLSMVSSMLTAIVTVVGVATVVHVIVRFRQARGRGLAPREALVDTLALLIAPITWACATDAVGFAALTVAKVEPVRDFGLMMAIGSLLVPVSVALVLPGLALLGRLTAATDSPSETGGDASSWWTRIARFSDSDPQRAWGERRLASVLEAVVRWVDERPRTLAAALVLITVAATVGTLRLDVETDFTRNFRDGSPIVRSYRFVEDQLGGAGVWDIVLPAPPRLTADYLARVRQLETRLRELNLPASNNQPAESALTKVISVADAMQAAEKNRLVGLVPVEIRIEQMRRVMPEFTSALITGGGDESRYLRIMLRSRERQDARRKQWVIDHVRQIVDEEFPAADAAPAGEVTGFYVLLTNLIKSMIRDQWTCFAVATLSIGLMMAIALRSLVLSVVALVPNILPILFVLGTMGWLGLKINMGAAMIAAVSIGLSVDSSIHYIFSFRRARAEGKSLYVALADVQQTVGRAVVFSTLALIVGFAVLCSSQFVPTIYFGGLVSLSMLGGLVGNLVVLPLLLKLVTRETKH